MSVLVMSTSGKLVIKPTFAEAVTSPDSVGKTIVITSPQTVSDDVTVPSGVKIRRESGGYLDVASGKKVAFEGGTIDEITIELFGGTAEVIAPGGTYPTVYNPCGKAFQDAINSAQGTSIPLVLYGTYSIDIPCAVTDTITIKGSDQWDCMLLNRTATGETCLTINGAASVRDYYANYSHFANFRMHRQNVKDATNIKLAGSAAFSVLDSVFSWGGLHGFHVTGTGNHGIVFNNCIADFNGLYGFYEDSVGNLNPAAQFNACTAEANTKGIYWASQCVINGGVYESNTENDIHALNTTTISNTYFEQAGTYAGDCMLRVEGYGARVVNCDFFLNSVNNLTAIKYKSLTRINNCYFSAAPAATNTLCIESIATGGTQSTISDIINDGVDTAFVRGSDTSATVTSSFSTKTTAFGHSDGGSNISLLTGMEPLTNDTMSLGASTKRMRYLYTSRGLSFAEWEPADIAINSTLFVDSTDHALKFKNASGNTIALMGGGEIFNEAKGTKEVYKANSPVDIATIELASAFPIQQIGGRINYSIYGYGGTGGTGRQSYTGSATFVAVNSAGTITCTIKNCTDDVVSVNTAGITISGSAAIAAGSSLVTLSINFATDILEIGGYPAIDVYFHITLNRGNTITLV